MTKVFKIKRVTPPRSQRRRYSIKEIIKAAQRVKEAVEREEKQYGKLGLAS